MKDKRRINVALTRAKYGMIIVGNYDCLSYDNRWYKLLTMLEQDEQIVHGVDEFYDFVKYYHSANLVSQNVAQKP
jgi:superfamily I DNA and/or RNA helicase